MYFNQRIDSDIDKCTTELELEKIKTKILFEILRKLDDISKKRLTWK